MFNDYSYDIESWPNVFTIVITQIHDGVKWKFAISPFRDDRVAMKAFFDALVVMGNARMVGFNNVGFDYPVLHEFLISPNVTAEQLYAKSKSIIDDPDSKWFTTQVRSWDVVIPQVDLYLMNHFDNNTRQTSLKALEIWMRLDSVKETSIPFDVFIEDESQLNEILDYNEHDVDATTAFYHECKKALDFRDSLTAEYNRDHTNFNDTKIGKSYFIDELEKSNSGICYNPDKSKRQTYRQSMRLADLIEPDIKFNNIEFEKVRCYLMMQEITETKGVFEGLNATVKKIDYSVGLGGLHGSCNNRVVKAAKNKVIIDVDVASYYPNLIISKNYYPEHLSDLFVKIYKHLYAERKKYAKGTLLNKLYKLALNGTYGDTNSIYSPLYDPAVTMSITLNGQLYLLMLAEWLMTVRGLEIIQANTDGITFACNPNRVEEAMSHCQQWEQLTGLELERADYQAMYIRDVNNYVAHCVNGDIKNKGAYVYDIEYHKDPSMLIVPKAAEQALLFGVDHEKFINDHTDQFDFMMRAKVPRSNKLILGENELQKTSRVFASVSGDELFKIMPPLAKNPTKERKQAMYKDTNVEDCSDASRFNWDNLNRDYYIKETEKLLF